MRKILIAMLIVTATSTVTIAAEPPAARAGAATPLVAAPVEESPLASAARARDFATVQALLKKKPDANQRVLAPVVATLTSSMAAISPS